VRTPKLNQMNTHRLGEKIDHAYLPSVSRMVWAEIGLGLYALATIIMLYPHLGWSIVPWMLIYALGYFFIAGLNLVQHVPYLSERLSRIFSSDKEPASASDTERRSRPRPIV